MRTFAHLSAMAAAICMLTAPAFGADTLKQIDIAHGGTTAGGMRIYNLSWEAIGGATYRVQWRPNFLAVNPWTTMDAVTPPASGTTGVQVLVDPNGADAQRGFFRVVLPEIQISEVQPSVVPLTGGTFYVLGQCFELGQIVKVDGSPVTISTFIDHNTFQILDGPFTPGYHTVTIEDAGGTVLATLPNGLLATATGISTQDSPPKTPYAIPVQIPYSGQLTESGDLVNGARGSQYRAEVVPWLWFLTRHGSSAPPDEGAVICQALFQRLAPRAPAYGAGLDVFSGGLFTYSGGMCDMPPGVCYINESCSPISQLVFTSFRNTTAAIIAESPRKIFALGGAPYVNEATGELWVESVDLVVPGRGFDFVWARTYRSMDGLDTPMGVGWDHSYNIRAQQVSGTQINVGDGRNRVDPYFKQPDGSFAAPEIFRRGTLTPAPAVFQLEFGDKSMWKFRAFDGTPAQGRIASIADRNGNTMQFAYNAAGDLQTITDTLGRAFQVTYSGAGRIQMLQDFTGRQIVYTHHNGAGPGGSLGDLLSARSPVVSGTPTANDFPAGKTARFTYTAGFPDAARNHNLLTLMDGNSVLWFTAAYTPAALPTAPDYDCIASHVGGIAGETTVFHYAPQTPAPANHFATTMTIVNDPLGHVHELLSDGKNRPLELRRYTGSSTPGVAVTETLNRPAGQLRPADPVRFRTRWQWNADALPLRIEAHDGNAVEFVWESGLDPSTSARFRANVRVLREVPAGPGAPLVWHIDHLAGFGSGECSAGAIFDVISHEWGHGMALNVPGGGENGTGEAVGDIFATTPSGPGGGGALWDPPSRRPPRPDTESGPRETDPELDWWINDLRRFPGWKPPDSTPPPLPPGTTSSGARKIDPMLEWLIYDLRRFQTRIVNPLGQTTATEYDAGGHAIKFKRPIPGAGTDFETNPFGQLTAVVLPPNHTGHRERIAFQYYNAGPQNGYLNTVVQDSGAGGLALTTTFEYNATGNLVRVVDPRSNDLLIVRNQLNQIVRVQSRDANPGPSVVRYDTDIIYDANNNVTRIDRQNKDEFGALGANTHFSTAFTLDALDHPASISREVSAGSVVTTQFSYDAKRNLTGVRTPRAVIGAEPDNTLSIQPDERELAFRITRSPLNLAATRASFSYNGNGQPVRIETGAPAGPQRVRIATYDGFSRRFRMRDPMGNETLLTYDDLHRVTKIERLGDLADVPGSAGNITLSRLHIEYDAMSRCSATKMELYDYPGVYQAANPRATSLAYDNASNVIALTDDNGNTSAFGYDTANRLEAALDAKGNRMDYARDGNGNVIKVTRTDKSDLGAPDQQFQRTNSFDALNRLISTVDNLGNSNSASFDSLSRCVRRVDAMGNHAQFEFDGLGRLLREGRDLGGNSFAFDPGDIIRLHAWDENSRRLTDNNANGYPTGLVYDALDRCTRVNHPDGTFETTVFDPWNHPQLVTDAIGTLCAHTYDDNGRLTQVIVTPGPGVTSTTTFEQFGYDGAGRVISAVNNAANIQFTYDSAGNVRTEKQGANTLKFAYDGAGRRVTAEHPGGRAYSYGYDGANLCTAVALTATADGDALGVIASHKYVGRRVERTDRRNQTLTEDAYDGAMGVLVVGDQGWGRVARITHKHTGGAVVDSRAFTYNANQALATRLDTRPGGPGLLHRHQYDGARRLTSTQVTAGPVIVRQTTYQLDREGNRIAVFGPGTPDAGPYQILAANPPADAQMNQYTLSPVANYLYDPNGNRMRSGGAGGNFTFAYDARNRLIDVTDLAAGSRVVTHLYDALGRRIRSTQTPDTAPAPLNYVHDGRAIVEERDGGGAVTASYSGFSCIPDSVTIVSRLMEEEGIFYFISGHGGDNHGRPIEQISFNFGGADDRPTEEVSFYYNRIAFRYSAIEVENDETHWVGYSSGNDRPMESLSINYALAVERRRGGVNQTFHTDAAGSTFALTNGAGAAVERYDYEDFGQPRFFDAAGAVLPGSAFGITSLWKSGAGCRFDPIMINYHNGPSVYDPRIGIKVSSSEGGVIELAIDLNALIR